MISIKLKLTVILIFVFSFANSQNKTYSAEKTGEQSLKIDGILDEEAWKKAENGNDFVQFEPLENAKPTQKTTFKVLYDENNIYFGISAFDSEPDKIEKRMSRRDDWQGDLAVIQIDSYHDGKTAFVFAVNAAGVRIDGVISNDDDDDYDDTPDPIWTAKTSESDKGWFAEIKIPLSQLHFSKREHQVWGLQVGRFIFRNNEWDIWQFISKDKAGWVSRFATLEGLNNLEPKRLIELAPYSSLKYEHYEKEEGNPFANGSNWGFNAGVDGKIGITNDLTLDFAVNPDFGQVESDPSEVNLTAFETFFSEKRTFFIEGNNIMNFGLTPGNSPWSSDNLFYSRRIGRRPQYYIYDDLDENEYAKVPENTTILGAIKLTGKTKKGLSAGIVESFTNIEYAEVDSAGNRTMQTVEPYTNYFAGRLQQDLNNGNTIIGGMVTSVNRFIDSEQLSFLNKEAYTGGIDFTQYFNDKKYFLSFQAAGSYISGSTYAVSEQQLSSRRYFQRPDADYLNYDSTLTSLSGYGGNLYFGKQSPKGFSYGLNITWRSPGFELNDIGYLRRANSIFHFVWGTYKITKPFSVFRYVNFSVNEWSGWDFGGTSTFFGGNFSNYTQFKNLWSFGFYFNKERYNIDNSILRGGPAMITPGDVQYGVYFSTKSTKKITVQPGYYDTFFGDKSGRNYGFYTGISYQPLNVLSLSIYPRYNHYRTQLQYVETAELQNDDRYIFAGMDQETFSLTLRINYNITPDFTIQYYGAPFISTGIFSDYKKISNPKADSFSDRFDLFNNKQISYFPEDESYGINESNTNDYDYYFSYPDFNFRQFRSNLILRWEYKPGSLFYFVWSQDKTDSVSDGNITAGQSLKEMFKISPFDVFLIKFSYRFIL